MKILFSWNFAYAKFRENKTLAKISEFTVHHKHSDRKVWANRLNPDQTAHEGAVWSRFLLFVIQPLALKPHILKPTENQYDKSGEDWFKLMLYIPVNNFSVMSRGDKVSGYLWSIWSEKNEPAQDWYLSHWRADKTQMRQHICAASLGIKLLAYKKYGKRWMLEPKIRLIASLNVP